MNETQEFIKQFNIATVENIVKKSITDTSSNKSFKIHIHENSGIYEGILFEIFPDVPFYANQIQIDGYYYPKTKRTVLDVYYLDDSDELNLTWTKLDSNEPRYRELHPFILHVKKWAKTYFEGK